MSFWGFIYAPGVILDTDVIINTVESELVGKIVNYKVDCVAAHVLMQLSA